MPTKANEEFRPFIRRLPEFKFWYSVTKSTIIALFCTMFELFNIPVFWPILVMYFITLFCITMKRQIKVCFFNLKRKKKLSYSSINKLIIFKIYFYNYIYWKQLNQFYNYDNKYYSLWLNNEVKYCLQNNLYLFILQHMIKYRYLPFTHGKPKYQNHDGNMRVPAK